MTDEITHPHILAALAFQKIADDEKFSAEERSQARLHKATMDAIMEAIIKVQDASKKFTPENPLCYMNAQALIEEFWNDPMQEQS